MSSKPTIYLLGDAILDNYHTLSNREQDLRKDISDLGFTVHNYAVDDVKVVDVINGITPREIYTKSRSYPYPIQKDGKMYPLKYVTSIIGVNRFFTPVYAGIDTSEIRPESMIVISIGGNDIHSKVKSVLLGFEYFINSVITPEFIANYRKVIETAKSSCHKIVLVSIYLPYLGLGSSYGVFTPFGKPVMERWHKFIHGLGREYNIPVLDLSRTLNVGERSHYGNDDTRVSNVASKCIADCIAYIYSHYQGYRVYYAPNLDATKIVAE